MAPSALQSEALYFQMYGLSAQAPEALNEALRRAIESMHRTLYAPSRDELTPSELDLLAKAGVQVEESPRRADPMIAYATEFAAILATSLSPARAGERLGGVTAVRVRQLIRERSLYALRLEGRWKIPVFQFGDEGLVPNIGAVNAASAVNPRPCVGASLVHPSRSGAGSPRRGGPRSPRLVAVRHGPRAGRRACPGPLMHAKGTPQALPGASRIVASGGEDHPRQLRGLAGLLPWWPPSHELEGLPARRAG